MNLSLIMYAVLNIAFVLIISPFISNLIKKVKAYCQGRKGPALMQSYYSLYKLFKKESVYSKNSSWIMRASPYINLVAVIVASVIVPLLFIPENLSLPGSILLFLYLLAISKFFMALAGLDAGSTFGGMGSSREMSISSIIEPVTVIVFLAFAYVLKSTDIFGMMSEASTAGSLIILKPALLPLLIALFIIIIAETGRIPVDNPETHLELTMIHEAMILEQSGKNLAMMEISHAIKHTLLIAIVINFFLPIGLAGDLTLIAIAISIASFLVKSIAIAIIIGLIESSLAKLRLFRLPNMLAVVFFLSFITILLEVFS